MPAATRLSISCSRWSRSSSSSSRSTASRRNNALRRCVRSASIAAASWRVEQQGHGSGECAPRAGLRLELLATAARQRIELGFPVVLRGAPLGLDRALALEAMQRRIERSLLHAQRILRDLLDAIGDGPAVLRLERERLEDQEIERSLRQIDLRRLGHSASPSASTGE